MTFYIYIYIGCIGSRKKQLISAHFINIFGRDEILFNFYLDVRHVIFKNQINGNFIIKPLSRVNNKPLKNFNSNFIN